MNRTILFLKTNAVAFCLSLSFLTGLTGCQGLFFFHGLEIGMNTRTRPSQSNDNPLINHEFLLEGEQAIIGDLAVMRTEKNDTLPDIARHFGLGHNEIVGANPAVDLWLPEPQTPVLVPLQFILPDAPRKGIVLNLANMRLFHFPEKQPRKVMTYPAGIGRDGWATPMGLTQVISKTKNPTWTVPPSIQREHALKGDPLPKAVPAGPDNPLGEYAMKLAKEGYLIHGTNKPYGVGMQISHGCLNLYPEDIRLLFDMTTVGTSVMIVEQPYLVAWQHDMLFLEAHTPLDASKNFKQPVLIKIRQLASKYKVKVDWLKVGQILRDANGIPTPILENSASLAELIATATPLPHPDVFANLPDTKPVTSTDWRITVASFTDERTAQKLTAVLNHQGPIIPAYLEKQGDTFHVIAGPFHSKKEAQSFLKRIEIELELKGTINPPTAVLSALELFEFNQL
jgi:L,D-transpeptidase ErfK/SrfK